MRIQGRDGAGLKMATEHYRAGDTLRQMARSGYLPDDCRHLPPQLRDGATAFSRGRECATFARLLRLHAERQRREPVDGKPPRRAIGLGSYVSVTRLSSFG